MTHEIQDQIQDRYRALFHALTQPSVLLRLVRDADGAIADAQVLDANAAAVAAARTDAATIIGKRLRDLAWIDPAAEIVPLAGAAVAAGEPQTATFDVDWGASYQVTVVSIGGDDVCLVAHDVTSLRATDDARHEAQERYLRAMSVVKDGVVVQDVDGTVIAANPIASEILGVPIDELTGASSLDDRWRATHPDGRPMPGEQHPAMITLRTGQACRDVLVNLAHADGRRIWLMATTEPLRDRTGRVAGVVSSFTDVTDEMAAGAEAQAIRERYQSTLQDIHERDEELRRRTAELEEARRVARLGTWQVDLVTSERTWSREMFELTGFDPEQPMPSTEAVMALMDPVDVALQRRSLEESARTGETWEHEYPLRLPEGAVHWVMSRGVADVDAAGHLVAAHGTIQDITSRKEAELALRASEEALRQRTEELEEARDIAGLGIWRHDPRSGETTWSPQLLKLFGLDDPADAPRDAQDQRRLFGEANVVQVETAAAESARTGQTVELELLIHRRDGEPRWVQQRIRTETDAAGGIAVATGTMIDITEQKFAEIALRDSEEELRQRTEELEEARRIAGLGVWRVDLVEERQYWSEEVFRAFGMDPADGAPDLGAVAAVLGEATAGRIAALTLRSAATGETWELEAPVAGVDDIERWVLHRGVAEVDADGDPIEIHGTIQDITERKRAELALAASEQRFRSVLDGLVEGAEILDREWRFVYVNRGFTRLDDREPSSLIGVSLFDVVPGIERTEIFDRFRRCMEERVPDRFEGGHRLPNWPAEQWWEFSIQPVPEGIFVLALDITARHQAEQRIAERTARDRERTARLEEAGRMARLGIWRRDAATLTATWSPEMYDLLEMDPSRPPPSPTEVDALITPETRAERDHVVAASLDAGVPWEVELELVLPSGHRRWVLQHGVAEFDATGAATAFRGTAIDITERKRTEQDLRRFNEALEQRVSERTAELEAINEELRSFSYTVSHDLRAPVRAVAGFARILERDHGAQLDDRALHSLTNIKTAGEAMGRLIDDLLAYTRIGRSAVRREPVAILPIARRLAGTFAARVEERGGAIVVEEPMATPVGDPTLVEELLINLVDNALNYGRPEVPPVVRLSAVQVGDEVRISVADNGVGIPPDMRERIFEVFTRLPGSEFDTGTGIGLAIVRKAARSMGSDVTVESSLGEGTTFDVLLPRAPAEAETAEA